MSKHIILIFYLLALILFSQSVGDTMGEASNFEAKIKEKVKDIDTSDGISKKEAIIMAQNELLNSEYKGKYDVTKPLINYDKGSKTWGIEFKLKKGCKDEDYWGVLIKEDTGEIYSGPLRDL